LRAGSSFAVLILILFLSFTPVLSFHVNAVAGQDPTGEKLLPSESPEINMTASPSAPTSASYPPQSQPVSESIPLLALLITPATATGTYLYLTERNRMEKIKKKEASE
jgi:hypothetical protein